MTAFKIVGAILGSTMWGTAWVIEAAGTDPQPVYEVFDRYPDGEGWREPGENDNDTSSVQSVTSGRGQ